MFCEQHSFHGLEEQPAPVRIRGSETLSRIAQCEHSIVSLVFDSRNSLHHFESARMFQHAQVYGEKGDGGSKKWTPLFAKAARGDPILDPPPSGDKRNKVIHFSGLPKQCCQCLKRLHTLVSCTGFTCVWLDNSSLS